MSEKSTIKEKFYKILTGVLCTIVGTAIIFLMGAAIELITGQYAKAKRVTKLEQAVLKSEIHYQYIRRDLSVIKKTLQDQNNRK